MGNPKKSARQSGGNGLAGAAFCRSRSGDPVRRAGGGGGGPSPRGRLGLRRPGGPLSSQRRAGPVLLGAVGRRTAGRRSGPGVSGQDRPRRGFSRRDRDHARVRRALGDQPGIHRGRRRRYRDRRAGVVPVRFPLRPSAPAHGQSSKERAAMKRSILALTLATLTALSLKAQETADPVWKSVDGVFGVAGKDLPGGTHRFGWPRRGLHVQVGDVPVQPALALGSWGAFLQEGDHAMAMGDLVLLEPELTPVLTTLEAGGLEISAIHNHLVGESPHVIYLHFSGHGNAAAFARTLKEALGKTGTPMTPSPPAQASAADQQAFKTVQEVLGRNGTLAGTVLQIGVPRAERIEEKGMEIPPSMGMATAL